jgi:hypothetical protein
MEQEAERLLIKEYVETLQNHVDGHMSTKPVVSPRGDLPVAGDAVENSAEQEDQHQPEVSLEVALPSAPKGLVLSRYVCNFGNVVKGQQKRRTFRVTNKSYFPVSFDLPKLLKGTVFAVEPDKAKRLAGSRSQFGI